MQLFMSLVGMVVLIAIAVLLSSNRRAFKLRTVLGAFIIQIGIKRRGEVVGLYRADRTTDRCALE